MGTEGRGDQTWDVMGEVQRGKAGGDTEVVPGIWPGLRQAGTATGTGSLALLPLPLPLSWLSARGSPTKLKSRSLPAGVWGGGGGSCLPPLFLAFSGHPPLAAALGSLRSVGATGDFLGVTPSGKMPGHLPTMAQLELSGVSTRRPPSWALCCPLCCPTCLWVSLPGFGALQPCLTVPVCASSPPHCLSSVSVSTHNLHPMEALRGQSVMGGPGCRAEEAPSPGRGAWPEKQMARASSPQPPPADVFKRCLGGCLGLTFIHVLPHEHTCRGGRLGVGGPGRFPCPHSCALTPGK